jgi:hypothetical protein
MVRGFFLDNTFGGRSWSFAFWAEGEPKISLWRGVTWQKNVVPLPVGAFRCKACGYLELFAREEYRLR